MKKVILFLVGIIILNSEIFAQDMLKFSAQVRPRFEVDGKDFNSNTDASTFSLLRTRLGAEFMPSPDISAFIQIQDSRTFGEETSTTANMKNLDLHQAYLKVTDLFGLPLDIKLGRMSIAYGSERIVSVVNWNNIGRSLDGGIATLKLHNVKLDFMIFREFERFNVGDSLDQNIYGLFADLSFFKSYKIQPFILSQRQNPLNLLNRTTLGVYINGKLGNFNHEMDFAYQTGKAFISGREQNLGGYTFSYGANYTFDAPTKPFVGAQIDYVSGDNNATDNDYKAFTTLYGTGHKFFGYMDYFTNFPTHTFGLGIIDIVAKAGVSLTDKWNLFAHFHLFQSAEDYILLNGSSSNSFGSEIDFVTNYKYTKNLTFELGTSLFFPGDIFKERRGKDTAAWAYAMAIFNF